MYNFLISQGQRQMSLGDTDLGNLIRDFISLKMFKGNWYPRWNAKQGVCHFMSGYPNLIHKQHSYVSSINENICK